MPNRSLSSLISLCDGIVILIIMKRNYANILSFQLVQESQVLHLSHQAHPFQDYHHNRLFQEYP